MEEHGIDAEDISRGGKRSATQGGSARAPRGGGLGFLQQHSTSRYPQRVRCSQKRTDGFYIEDDIGDKAMASDKYCRNQEAGERILVGAAANSGQEDHDVPDLPTRPGAVLQGQGTAPWAAGER